MPTESDVPLGDGSRRYYEELFDERIRQINKDNSARRNDSSDSNNNGRLGCGVLIAVFLLIRLFTAFLNTHSHTTTHRVSPPPPPPFKVHQPIIIDHPGIDVREEDERRFLDQLREGKVGEEKRIRIQPRDRAPDGAKR